MKKICSIILIFLTSAGITLAQSSIGSSSYDAGVGVHLGETFGVSYRKNMGKNAWDVTFGLSPRLIATSSDQDYLASRKKFDGYFVTGGSFSVMPSVQFHYLWQYNISALEGLTWHWGFGPQFRFRTYNATGINLFTGDFVNQRGVDIDLGIDGVIGADYKFKKLPLAVYADIIPFFECFDKIVFYPMGGVGARYTF